jgi:hypothetical protein
MELDGTDHLLVFYFFGENSYHRKIENLYYILVNRLVYEWIECRKKL